MQLLTPTAVGKRLGVSAMRVRQLDSVLQPRRTETGVRVYDPARVDELAGARSVLAAAESVSR